MSNLSLIEITLHELIGRFEGDSGQDCGSVVNQYGSWIAFHPGHPQLAAAWFNLGCMASQAGLKAEATFAYSEALRLKPDLHQAAINLGLLQERAGAPELALQIWNNCIQSDEARILLLNQRGRLLESIGDLKEAEATLRSSLTLDPDQPDATQHWVHIRQKMCEWPAVPSEAFGKSASELLLYSGPLGVLALVDDVATQSAVTSKWVEAKTHETSSRLSPTCGHNHSQCRLGYLSSDFGSHAMGYLIAELFEKHDRENFSVYGYTTSESDSSDLYKRMSSAFDFFTTLDGLGDKEAAERIAADEIDILIDLNGLTKGARPQILRWKPAPIQATYLGFVGPVPIPELDYLLCDDYVVPRDSASLYQPIPLYISSVFQANDTKRGLAATTTRSDIGLSEEAFIFCNFGNHYKITPGMFSAWLQILTRVPGSMLWLAFDNKWSSLNLRKRFEEAGLSPERLVISDRVDPIKYMGRFALADLYLDTSPYNSGTVASDAIRMSLPIVTLRGASFASRMAARLLDAIGAQLGIAETFEGYVQTAVLLASDKRIRSSYADLFNLDGWLISIGNIDKFRRDLEGQLLDCLSKLREQK